MRERRVDNFPLSAYTAREEGNMTGEENEEERDDRKALSTEGTGEERNDDGG
jgi:hypothetical protein